MKKALLNISCLAFLIFGLSLSCKDEEDFYRPPGPNTFGCYVNGELWTPISRGGGSTPFGVDRSGEFFLAVYAENHKSHTGIMLTIIDSSGLKANHVYYLTNDRTTQAGYHFRAEDITCFYGYEEMISGKMVLTKLGSGNVSGTFEFTTFNPDCGDTIRVTEGSFDLGKIAY